MKRVGMEFLNQNQFSFQHLPQLDFTRNKKDAFSNFKNKTSVKQSKDFPSHDTQTQTNNMENSEMSKGVMVSSDKDKCSDKGKQEASFEIKRSKDNIFSIESKLDLQNFDIQDELVRNNIISKSPFSSNSMLQSHSGRLIKSSSI